MFYSHQLLARKAPLGQIWMAATVHAKINRKRLHKLDIVKICDEILNPTVPMALRLSGILMGGVVIVYERKVKLLYDDVSRLLVEVNEAWRIKPAADPTVLPKGKAQAKYEAVTLPETVMDFEVEQPMLFSETDTARFRGMRLEDLDDQYFNINLDDENLSCAQHHHQAEAANITLVDNFGSGLAETDIFNRFERFDIADEDTTVNVTPNEQPEVPSTIIPSPPRQEEPPQPQEQCNAVPSPIQEEPQQGGAFQEQEQQKTKRREPLKRKASRNNSQVIMDNDQIMIPGNIYQTWLRDPTSLTSKRPKVSSRINPIRSTKISNLMDWPLVALISCLDKSTPELYCPEPLMHLWRESTEVKSHNAASSHNASSCGHKSASSQERQPRSSPPQEFQPQPQGAYDNEMGSHPMDFTENIEKLRENLSTEYERAYDTLQSGHSVTPGSPGQSHRSASSSGSGRKSVQLEPEVQLPSGRSKRSQYSSRKSLGNLDPVEEEFPLEQAARDFKIRRLSDIGPTPELLEETAPTQTPYHVRSDPIDKVTQSICTHLKLHFDTPGAPQSESLNQLAYGMSVAKAAQLFYQTCVLATHDFIKVEQPEPYGDILISKGPKM